MESMFTYVSQTYLNQLWFQYGGKRGSGSRIMVRRTHPAIFGRCTIFLITQIRLDSCVPGYPDRVETDLSDQKNGTSAENGGTCAPYPIIREPELCLPYDWNHGWFRYVCKTYVSIDSINGVLHIIIVTVSNVFRRNFRLCHQKKLPLSRPFNCWGKLKKNRISFLYSARW